ncbi:hypothetical protein KKZ94_00950 [Enterobacter hormaechei]|nr:hypothetical protein [Enterobacter hormaechei]
MPSLLPSPSDPLPSGITPINCGGMKRAALKSLHVADLMLRNSSFADIPRDAFPSLHYGNNQFNLII